MKPTDQISYTTEDLAELLQVSKLTVYDLIKKGEITAYRVGRQMRVDAEDLEAYKTRMKSGPSPELQGQQPGKEASPAEPPVRQQASAVLPPEPRTTRNLIISGQDLTLDLLANAISASSGGWRILRSHSGSLSSLISLLQGEADLVSTHLFDGDTGSYNMPYIRRILTGREYTVIHLLSRKAGLYVQFGNPKQITGWRDLNRNDIRFVNRELGSGIRVLTDERLRLEGILPRTVNGYDHAEMTHLAVAGKVASGDADAGVGIEKTASLVNVDFVPLAEEQYDIVMLKKPDNETFRETVIGILQSESFRKELSSIQGYDFSRTGQILFDTP